LRENDDYHSSSKDFPPFFLSLHEEIKSIQFMVFLIIQKLFFPFCEKLGLWLRDSQTLSRIMKQHFHGGKKVEYLFQRSRNIK